MILFLDNKNIETSDLWIVGIDLLESGKTKLAQNFIFFKNNSYWLSPYHIFLEAHRHETIDLDTLNYQT